jgi:glycosyltransferase involved in cell wall biosynthesis
MIRLLNKLKYKKLVIGGWDLVEFWTALIISKKEKNCLALESTIYESPAIGIKSLFKKIFVSRVSIAFVSGAPHKKLMAALGFKGICKVTKGVGLINKPQISFVGKPFEGKFLCVARLSAEKNLEMLIEAFNGLPFSLTIIGDGPLELGLKKLAKDNISFIPHVPNKQIGNYYLSHDALILPSLRETWGLVVEEALYYGLPAIVSNRVGSCDELIKNGINGMIFDPSAINGLRQSILYLSEEDNYEKIRGNVLRDGLAKKDQDQINSYLETV